MDNIRYTGNNEIPQNRKLFVKEQNKKIEELDKLYDKCMDLKFKNTGSKITIPINMFRRFTDIILLQKRSLVYEIGEKLEYDSLLTQNSELKQKVTENEISNIVDEEYIVDDSDEDILNKDIDLDTGTIVTLIRKSRRTHEFPLSKHLLNHLPYSDNLDSPIFPELYNEDEQKLNDNLAKPRLFMQSLLKVGNRQHATLHSFRVTFNNQLLNLGCGIEDRQKLLAHSSSETTKIYTHPNIDLARDYVDQLPDYFK